METEDNQEVLDSGNAGTSGNPAAVSISSPVGFVIPNAGQGGGGGHPGSTNGQAGTGGAIYVFENTGA